MLEFNVGRAFKPVFATDKLIIDIVGGRGRGGSYFGTDYFLYLLTTARYFRGCFLRQAFNDIRDSLFKDFKDRIEEHDLPPSLFHINESEMRIAYLPNGNTIISKGFVTSSNRTAKLKSLAGITHVLIEEANEVSEEQFDQLLLSLRTKKAEKIKAIRIFNPPPKRHWIWKGYNLTESDTKGYYSYAPKSDSNIEMCFATYLDNVGNLNAEYIATLNKLKDRPEQYNTIVRGLISDGNVGRIYSGFKHCTAAEWSAVDSRTVYAVDFGYSEDPTATIAVKWKDNKLFIKELTYNSGMDDLTIAKRWVDLGVTYRDLIIADYGNGGDVRIHNLRSGGGVRGGTSRTTPICARGLAFSTPKKGREA
ncbi:MAG: phage terminase large subunit [Prevotellaceae bacterium]|jgi:phage terminase large subunit|nr:phage terminase large subunit [Prevotellaceae bacterium]